MPPSKRKFWDVVMNDRIPLTGAEKQRLELILYGVALHGREGPWAQVPKQRLRMTRRMT